MQNELLFEIGTEELPAGFIQPALTGLEEILGRRLTEVNLTYAGIRLAATPRRLAVSVSGLPERQPDRREEFVGPPVSAAYDAEGNPTRAASGFAASRGVSVDELQEVTTEKGRYIMATLERKGIATRELLPEILAGLVRELPFPKSMRWGEGELSFARPIHWFLALFGGEVVPFKLAGIKSGATTRGHRFMAPDEVRVTGFDQYLEKLRAHYVLADMEERRAAVRREINRCADTAAGVILADEELEETVTHLVEWPRGINGVFEDRFLALPDAVLVTAMREHQKYFCVTDTDGGLRPNFVAVNNTRVSDEGLAAEGHQRVLRARLEDALFFFNEDQRRPLTELVDDLNGLIFQARLGTMAEKTERITRLSRLLGDWLAPDHREDACRAATLAKADLLSAMVVEFPSLQGVVGREYALLQGEKPAVATAIHEHYLPVRSGGELPGGITGALVGMADRLDTIVGCFGIGQVPTGTADPFGLRRLALGLLHLIEGFGFSLSLPALISESLALYGDKLTEETGAALDRILDFIRGRFTHDLTARGIPATAVEAVTSVSFEDPGDCRARIDALAAIRNQPTFTVLAEAFKRVMNIIKDNRETTVDPAMLTMEAERRLFDSLAVVGREAEPLLAAKRYEPALEVLMKMKEPVDVFFDDVLVMAEDQDVRRNRLNLLTAVAELFLRVGDFSRMQVG